MENIKSIEISKSDGEIETHVLKENDIGEFTSMLKSTYDEMIASQKAAIVSKKKTNSVEEVPAE
jgi:hypothetical protein